MRKWFSGNSRKGLTLPVAMAVGIFLVLIASSLLFIAINSTSRTGSDKNGRQAYLNVKSALEYARAYYNSCDDLSAVGDAEYMIMKDEGGTTSGGADISKNQADTENATTYVIAQYFEPQNSDPASLKLSAFSRYSDPFGNKPRTARLSITFTVGSSAPTRYTPFVIPGKPPTTVNDTITLHVKQPKDMNYQLSYYIWTYEDNGNAYDDYYKKNLEKTTNTFDYYPPNVQAFNATTTKENEVKPNGVWAPEGSSNGRVGPPAIMATTSSNDLWTTGEYTVKSGRVPWFNIIFAAKGSVLSVNDVYNSQTNEMLHLWYLDPNDKNIYFEFTGTTKNDGSRDYITKYHEGKGWDGRKGLEYETDPNSTNEDTVIVYVRNQKTCVHFRVKDKDDTSTTHSFASGQTPVITDVVNSDGTSINMSSKSYIKTSGNKTNSAAMVYEGCGWWVANIETGKKFRANVTFNGISQTVTITPNSESEAWLIFKNGTISVHQTEKAALYNLDVDPDSYVTVRSKVANYRKPAQPILSYSDVKTNSSAGKIRLQNKVIEANQITVGDYTEETGQALTNSINEATELLNNADFIASQEGSTTEEKARAADIEYDRKRKAIEEAIKNLVPSGLSPSQLEPLEKVVKRADNIVKAEEEKGLYDYETYTNFTATTSPYKIAKNAFSNPKNLKSSDVDTMIVNLNEAIGVIESKKLNRAELQALIDEGTTLRINERYDSDKRTALGKTIDGYDMQVVEGRVTKTVHVTGAKEVVAEKFISQSVIDGMSETLRAAIDDVKSSLIIPNCENLNELISTAHSYINSNAEFKHDCTDETYNALVEALNAAEAKIAAGIELQSEVTAVEEPLEKAVANFSIVKPANCIDMLAQNTKIIQNEQGKDVQSEKASVARVYVKNDNYYTYTLKQFTASSTGDTDAVDVQSSNMKKDNATGWYYFDVDQDSYVKVKLSVFKNKNKVLAEMECDIGDPSINNILLEIDSSGKITRKTVTTVYSNDSRFNNIKGKIGSTSVSYNYEEPYYAYRFITSDSQKFSITTGSYSNKKTYTIPDVLTAGDFIMLTNTTDTTVKVVKAEDVYPKYVKEVPAQPEPTQPENPEPGQTSEPQTSPAVATDSDYEIVNVDQSHKINPDDFRDLATTIPAGKSCVLVGYNSKQVFNKKLPAKIYAWQEKSDGSAEPKIGAWDSMPQMSQVPGKSDFYYYFVPDDTTHVFICDNDKNKVYKTRSSGASDDNAGWQLRTDGGAKYQFYSVYLNPDHGSTVKVFNITDTGTPTTPTTPTTPAEDEYDGPVNTSILEGITIGDKKTCIILDGTTGNLRDLILSGAPYLYCWGGSDRHAMNGAWPGTYMLNYEQDGVATDYYYMVVDGNLTGLKLCYHSGSEFTTSDVNVRTLVDNYYKYIILSSGTGTSVNYSGEDYPPVIETPVLTPEMDTHMQMVYVGGRKVRITNRSYDEIYGDNTKTNDYGTKMKRDENMFGGEQINNDSGGRVGASKLSAYFDWYEIKIPVPKSTQYSFEITGMNPDDPSKKTVQFLNAYGDVWVTQLDNKTMTSGRYSNLQLFTYDSENDEIPENLIYYFKMPTKWTDLSVSAHGIGDNFTATSSNMTKLTRQGNIIAIKGMSKRTPFITFTVKDSKGDTKVYKTSLPGGNNLLFDPTYNGNYGGWREFVSDNEKLMLVARDLLADFYGHLIVNVYNSDGEVVEVKGDNNSYASGTYFYSKALAGISINGSVAGKKIIDKANDSGADYNKGTYRVMPDTIDSLSDDVAYTAYVKLSYMRDLLRDLYQQMSIARKFISTPQQFGHHSTDCVNGKYPEFLSRTDYKQYSAGSVHTLVQKLKDAEAAYLDYNMYYSTTSFGTWENALSGLKRAIANMDIKSEASIGCLLYDAQSKVSSGTTFKISYKENKGDTKSKVVPVPERNPENYPIIFIVPTNSSQTIYDVQFIENTITGEKFLEPKKNVMRVDDDIEWVYFDSSKNPYWTPNSSYDYRQVSSDTFVQESKNEVYPFAMHQKYKMVPKTEGTNYVKDENGDIIYIKQESKDSKGRTAYEPMTILFTYDTKVYLYNDHNNPYYTIKAGSYSFDSAYEDPIISATYKEYDESQNKEVNVTKYCLNLFSDKAKEFFTNADRYGKYTSNAVDAVTDLHWHNGKHSQQDVADELYNEDGTLKTDAEKDFGVFKTGYNPSGGVNVNFEADSGNFLTYGPSYTYYSTEGLYFRWSSIQPLYTATTPVIFQAEEIRIASMGTIDGTKNGARDPKFLIKSKDMNAKSMKITFLTDVTIKYDDLIGGEHQFTIREGSYEIEMENAGQDYIANLYDETYWKSMVHVKPLSGTTTASGPSDSKLLHGTYGK